MSVPLVKSTSDQASRTSVTTSTLRRKCTRARHALAGGRRRLRGHRNLQLAMTALLAMRTRAMRHPCQEVTEMPGAEDTHPREFQIPPCEESQKSIVSPLSRRNGRFLRIPNNRANNSAFSEISPDGHFQNGPLTFQGGVSKS